MNPPPCSSLTPIRTQSLERVCDLLSQGEIHQGAALLCSEYPFRKLDHPGRSYTPLECTQVFLRDGFVDRYSGDCLVFPGTLRLMSRLMPEAMPFHNNWKMSDTHPAFWECFPTIDHVVPVARGGADDQSNWVSTSMLRNSAKSNWTLEELGWQLSPPGQRSSWNGLLDWYLDFMDAHPALQKDLYLGKWYRAGASAMAMNPRS